MPTNRTAARMMNSVQIMTMRWFLDIIKLATLRTYDIVIISMGIVLIDFSTFRAGIPKEW